MEHYYTQNPNTPHHIEKIEYSIQGTQLQFLTDSGVFSKKRVDFGTDLMLRSLPHFQGNILDLGCGYGAIGITTASLNPQSFVTMIDVNERAVDLTNQNILLNKVNNAQVFQSDGFTNVSGLYDLIVSNPPVRTGKKVIYPLFENSKDYLQTGGMIYLVIQKKQGAKSAITKLQEIFGNCEVVAKENGYWIFRSQR